MDGDALAGAVRGAIAGAVSAAGTAAVAVRARASARRSGANAHGGRCTAPGPRAALALAAAFAAWTAVPAAAVEPYQEYAQKLRAAQQLTALDDGLFGDSVSLFNGGTEFSLADIDLPGNDALPVQLRRRLNIVAEPSISFIDRFGGIGNWDVDVPSISGVLDGQFKWNANSAGQPVPRCSARFYPSTGPNARLADIFNGFTIRIPGAGSKTLLGRDADASYPDLADGQAHLWTTRDLDTFTCTPMKNGYPGEGFVMHTPDGLKYRFDVGVERAIGAVQGRNNSTRTRVQVFLLASQVEDRFGNRVEYHYDSAGYPQRILASDGREIVLDYADGRLQQATANGRQWQYQYSGGRLERVVLPDGSAWGYAYSGSLKPLYETWDGEMGPSCAGQPAATDAQFALNATHPSGASGVFEFRHLRHPRSGVRKSYCVIDQPGSNGEPNAYHLAVPNFYDMFSLVSKTLSGPGLDAPLLWQYRYGSGRSALWGTNVPVPGSVCTDRSVCSLGKTSSVIQPDGSSDLYRYGMQFGVNEGRLLGKRRVAADGKVVREETYDYIGDDEAAAQPFSPRYGHLWGGDDVTSTYARPLKRTTIAQDGFISSADPDAPPATASADASQTSCQGDGCSAWFNLPQPRSTADSAAGDEPPADTYVEAVEAFDAYARPLRYRRYNSLGYSRQDAQEYHDHLARWVLGQVARTSTDAVETARTEFDPDSAMPLREFSFGKRLRTRSYRADGTLATLADGNDRTTVLSGWKRGVPQSIAHPDGNLRTAVVDDNGWILSVADENGYVTGYGYDAMGRATRIDPPGGDDVAWNITTARFEPVAVAEQGLAAGHWRHVSDTGRQRKTTYFDAFWRPVAELSEDTADPAGTQRWRAWRYDHQGRAVFESYPRNPAVDGALAFNAAMPGTHTVYDPLGRVTEVRQDSELGVLSTKTEYLGQLLVRTTNPRNRQTLTSHQAYHQPGYDWPRDIGLPEGVYVDIERDVFGRTLSLRRRNADASQSALRRYVYDPHGQLCKRIEPESGATVMDYDGAGNLAWSAGGLALPDPGQCNRAEAQASGRRVDRGYDLRNRPSTLAFPDGRGDQAWTYWPDGLVRTVTTHNDGPGQGTVTNAYDYNKRRLLRGESLAEAGGASWSIGYGYDPNGSLERHVLPSGQILAYAPNALGQASGVWNQSSGGTLADSVRYYPNGAIKSFVYGNGIVHSLQLNARQLPQRSSDAGVLDLETGYDAGGNVVQILDRLRGAHYDRALVYDGLDRLAEARSCRFGGDCLHRFGYDALDNIASWQLGGVKQHAYWYDDKNRLTNIKNEAGATVVGLGYDVQGNLDNKNGQAYAFDYGNRLRAAVGKQRYRYDGHGRRYLSLDEDGGQTRSLYGQDGVLRRTEDLRTGQNTEYAYLGGSLLARLIVDTAPAMPELTMPAFSNSGAYTAQWAAVPGANRYELQERATAGAWQGIYDGPALQHAISGRSDGAYDYRLRACASVCGAWSATRSTAVALPPAGELVLNAPASVIGGNYVVGWNALSGAGEYVLEENPGGAGWQNVYTGPAQSRSFASRPGGQYRYRGKACNPAGCGPFSQERTVEVLGAPSAAPELSLPGYSNNGTFSASWTAVAGASSYELEQQHNGGGWTRVYFDAATSTVVSGRATGSYGFRVKGCNAAGCGPASAVEPIEVLVPPMPPTLNAPGNSPSGQYEIAWTGAATATGYSLEESANGGPWAQVYSGGATAATVSGRGNGSYAYRVQACNSSGCGGYSNSATTTVFLPPPVPRITYSERKGAPNAHCLVQWAQAPTAASYELMAQPSGVVQYVGPDLRVWHVSRYCAPSHVLRACNAAGCSAWSSPPAPQQYIPGDPDA